MAETECPPVPPPANAAGAETLREQSLTYSLRDGMAWSVMIGFGDNYVGPYALFLGATTFQMGVLASLPPFVGAVSQIFAAALTERIGVRKKVIVAPAIVQAFTWLLILSVPMLLSPAWSILALIGLVTLLHTGGHFTVPAWMSLMGDIVPPDIRGSYFARRNRICQLITMASVALAGWLLSIYKEAGPNGDTWGFVSIFAVACVARLFSARYLHLQYDPPYTPRNRSDGGFRDYLRAITDTNFGQFALFMSLMSFAVCLAGPFFVVYIMRDLGLTYGQFTLVMVTNVLSQIVTLVFWGKAADRFGNKWTLMICGGVLAAIPLTLPLSTHLWFIIAFMFVASSAGAGFNLAAANYVFEAVGPERLTRNVAYYHVTNAAGVLAGSLLGGWLAGIVPARVEIGAVGITFVSSLMTVYMISATLRISVLILFRNRFREIRHAVPEPNARELVRIAVQESDFSRWLTTPHKK